MKRKNNKPDYSGWLEVILTVIVAWPCFVCVGILRALGAVFDAIEMALYTWADKKRFGNEKTNMIKWNEMHRKDEERAKECQRKKDKAEK